MKTERFGELEVEALNLNISAYRVLYILLVLVQHQSLSLTVLNRFLHENPLIQRVFNNETVTKYINTLRKAGCRIPRSSVRNDFHYTLEKSPFPLMLTDEETDQLIRSVTVLLAQADEPCLPEYLAFLEKVAWSLQDARQAARLQQAIALIPGEETPEAAGAEDTRSEAERLQARERIALFRRFQMYCSDALMLSIDYPLGKTSRLTTLTMEPQRVVAEGRNFYLLGRDYGTRRSIKLDLDKIEAVRQLPAKNRTGQARTTIVFQLYGRLARNYRPYPGEEVHLLGEETLQVRSKTDDPQALLCRLLKYDRSCQVIYPAGVRDEIRTRIQSLMVRMQEA